MNAETDYIYKIEDEIYPLFKNIFHSKATINSSRIDDLVNVIGYVNAFYTRFRYYESLDNLKAIFLAENGEEKIKRSIEYLIFGADNYQTRIANCIYRQEYKLSHFGSSCVKEFYGWINAEEIPLCNDRTLKTMQWLGFGKLL
ncbi:MAG: hypothetical protein IPG24_26915 [Leptospiraceae bacterium]|nr:hypothetical protein [Leptospiraceae bacterium]